MLIKIKQVYPMEAVQLNIFCLMQDNGWMVLQQCICGTQSWIYCTRKLEVTSNLYIKRKYPKYMIHVLQHANGIVHLRTSQQLEGTRTKGPCADERWTQLTLLVNVMTHTTFTRSTFWQSSAFVNPLFFSTCKRAGKSFATSAGA